MKFNLRYESNGKTVNFYDGRFPISELKGLSENVISLSTSQGSNQDGKSVGGRSVDSRSITITGDIRDPDADRVSLLAAILPKEQGKLYLSREGFPEVYLDVEVTKTPIVENIFGVQSYQVVFEAPFPYWKTSEQVNNTLWGYRDIEKLFSVEGDGSGTFENFDAGETFDISVLLSVGYVTVWNLGNVPLPVVFDITARAGSATNFSVYLVGSSPLVKMRYIGTLNEGERVVIDTNYGEKSATKYNTDDTTENVFSNIDEDSDWSFSLPVGASQVGYAAASGRDNLEVVFKHPKGIYSGV